MTSRLAWLSARVAARRQRAFSTSSSSSAAAAAAPRPLLPFLPTSASALALAHGASTPALVDSLTGQVTTFSRLSETAEATAEALRSSRVAAGFEDEASRGRHRLDPETGARASGPRVAVLGRPSPAFAAALWGVWAAGGCAVPLHHSLPERAMAVSLADVGASAILFSTGDGNGDGDGSGSGGGGASSPSFSSRAASLAALAASTPDANGRTLSRAPACLPWAPLRGGEEFRGGGGGGEGRSGASPCPSPSSSSPSSSSSSSSPFPADPSSGALVIFTSGTTGRPKPALHSHLSIKAQADSLKEAWELERGDLVLNCLPWHHIHGLVNALVAPLAAGAAVEVAEGFSPAAAWNSLCRGRGRRKKGDELSSLSPSPPSSSCLPPFPRPVSIFMGVPTMYSHLLTALESERSGSGGGGNGSGKGEGAKPKTLPSFEEAALAAASLRLSICGSAACPVPLARRWDELVERGKRERGEEGGASSSPLTSSTAAAAPSSSPSSASSPSSSSSLLERYGMTEAGMILGQSLKGPRARGVVGRPMPGVEVKLRRGESDGCGESRGEEEEEEKVDSLGGSPPSLPAATGELLVRWPGMFSAYWGRAKETSEAFAEGKWFATGDVALRSPPSTLGPSSSSSSSPSSSSSSPSSSSSSPSSSSSSPSSSSSSPPTASPPSLSNNDYRLLGRASVDIIKVGGEKVSALEVEDALVGHERVAEAAVVGVEGGGARGEAVAAALVAARSPSPPQPPLPTLSELRSFLAEILPKAAIPTKAVFVDALPRNAMGKVDKKRVKAEAFGSGVARS